MPSLQVSSETLRSTNESAQERSQLQQRHLALKARAAKVAAHEDVVSIYHLGDVIAEIEADQALHGELGQITESITLHRVIARLKALLPIR